LARALYILSIDPQQLHPLIERLTRNRFEPDAIPSLRTMPSSYMHISLTITIFGEHQRRIVERIFDMFQVLIVEGIQYLKPTAKEKFVMHILDMWKETIAIFIGSLIAVHATVVIILYLHNIDEFHLSFVNYIELIFVSAIPSVIHLLTGHKKYQDTVI